MKKAMALLVAAAAVVTAPAARAATAFQDFDVTASVATSCAIDSATTLAFGAYTGGAINSTSTILVTCVATTPVATLGLGDGLHLQTGSPGTRAMSDGGTHLLTYSLNVTNGSGACWGGTNVCAAAHAENVTQDGTQKSFTVYGSVGAGQTLYAGSYSDTVRATVNF